MFKGRGGEGEAACLFGIKDQIKKINLNFILVQKKLYMTELFRGEVFPLVPSQFQMFIIE